MKKLLTLALILVSVAGLRAMDVDDIKTADDWGTYIDNISTSTPDHDPAPCVPDIANDPRFQ